MYFAANKVFRSDDRGNTWQVISDDLTQQIDRNKLEVMGKIWPMDAVAKNAIHVPVRHHCRPGRVSGRGEPHLCGTDDGLIQVTDDGGVNWTKIGTFPGVPERTYVNDIIASRHDRDTVYAAFNNHKNGDFKPYILKSTDLGRSWTSISSNFPERGSVYALEEDHVNGGLLFAGTEFGLFVTVDGGGHWTQLKNGLPTIAVRDLAVQRRENDLVLATFGRGFYILDDYSPLRFMTGDVLRRDAHIFPVKDAWMFVEERPLGSLGSRSKGFQGESYFTVPNPPVAAAITYYLKDDFPTLRDKRRTEEQKIQKAEKPVFYPTYEQLTSEQKEESSFLIFTILDEEGQIVRHLRTPAGKGLHRITWDLRYPALTAASPRDADPATSGPSSTFVFPGSYKVKMSLSAAGEITPLAGPVSFKVKTPGTATLPAEDKAALVAFQKKARKLGHAVNAASSVIRDLNQRIPLYKAALKGLTVSHTDLYKEIQDLETDLQNLQLLMFGDPTKGRLDMDTQPGIARRISSAIYEQWNSTSAPTRTQLDAFQIVEEEFAPVYEKLQKILSLTVKNIEKRLDDIGAPFTPGRLPDWRK